MYSSSIRGNVPALFSTNQNAGNCLLRREMEGMCSISPYDTVTQSSMFIMEAPLNFWVRHTVFTSRLGLCHTHRCRYLDSFYESIGGPKIGFGGRKNGK